MKNKKVYGSLNSAATLKVLACLFEHDLDFDFVPIDLEAGEHKKKPFLSMNVSSLAYIFLLLNLLSAIRVRVLLLNMLFLSSSSQLRVPEKKKKDY